MSPAGLARPGPERPMSDEPLSSSEQVSGTRAVFHAEAQVRLLSLATGGLLAPGLRGGVGLAGR
jgi:hypothetical protein